MSELRYNPLLGEWTATATARQDRTFLPPAGFCPLCPTKPGGFPTEIPAEDFDLVVFENKFPSLRRVPDAPAIESDPPFVVEPSYGTCEVVVYTPDHNSSLARETPERIHKLLMVWTDRYRALSELAFVKYVFIFENKGEAVGVTLHHPHGQIYAYPFVPPLVQRELNESQKFYEQSGKCLMCTTTEKEIAEQVRVVAENTSFAAIIPFAARYPFETHIYAKRHFGNLLDMTAGERRDLALLLKQILAAFDRIFDVAFPYIMSIHQTPTDGGDHGHYHFHIEFYPPMRTATKLKYLAGSEAGAGMFINDTLPEEKAVELRSHIRPASWTER